MSPTYNLAQDGSSLSGPSLRRTIHVVDTSQSASPGIARVNVGTPGDEKLVLRLDCIENLGTHEHHDHLPMKHRRLIQPDGILCQHQDNLHITIL
jgi:hypothetical protein